MARLMKKKKGKQRAEARKLIQVKVNGRSLSELLSNQQLPVTLSGEPNHKNIFMVYIS